MNSDSRAFVAAYLRSRRLARQRQEATRRLMRLYAVSLAGRAR